MLKGKLIISALLLREIISTLNNSFPARHQRWFFFN